MNKIKKSLSICMAATFVMAGILGNVTAKAAVVTPVVPIINYVGIDHAPLLVGDTESFKLTASNYEGKVQYAAFMFDGTKWSNLSGYCVATDSKTPYTLAIKNKFKSGKYKISIWVRKAGVVGAKSSVFGDYESVYATAFNTVARSSSQISVNGNAKVDVNGMKLTFNGIENICGFRGPYVYQLNLLDSATGKWSSVAPYSANPEYTFATAGTYVLSVHVRSVLSTKAYQAWKTIIVTVSGQVDPNLAAANTAVLALQTAVTKDLTISANLTGVEALVQPTKDAVAKVINAATKITLNNSVTIATKTITEARTAFNAAAYVTLKAGVETNVAAYEAATTDLSTQALINSAKDLKTAVVLTGINAADTATFQARIDIADATVVAAQKVIDNATTTVNVFTTTVSAAPSGVGAMVNVDLTADGTTNFATATKFIIFDGVNPISNSAVLGKATTVYPAKALGDTVTVKLLDASNVVVKAITVKLGEDGTITVLKPVEVITTATIATATFGSNVTVTSNKVGAVKYQIWNDTNAITASADLGTSTLILNQKAGNTVTVKLFDADGTVVSTTTAVVLVAAK